MNAEQSRATDIKVGIFVALGVVTLVLVVFLIGQERHFFERPVFLKARFKNVAGLKVGAAVRLAGVDVGIVSTINFPELIDKPDIGVVKSTAVAGKFDGEGKTLVLRGLGQDRQGKDIKREVAGWRLPLHGDGEVVTFPSPTHAVLVAEVQADEGKQTADLSSMAVVAGLDQWGGPIVDELELMATRPGIVRVKGVKRFKQITDVVVTYARGGGVGESISIGVEPERLIVVTMRVQAESLHRIREGSMAKVDSMGLLGDKTIDITMGSSTARVHQDGQTILSDPSGGLEELISEVKAGIDEIKGTFAGTRTVVTAFLEGGGEARVNELLDTINELGEEVKHGRGLVHQLIYADTSGSDYQVHKAVGQVNVALRKVNKTLQDVDEMVDQVKTNDSVLHEAVYGEGGEQVVASATKTLEEARQILADVREKNGIVHQLIYKEDDGQTIANVTQVTEDLKTASSDVRELVAEVKRGEGTLGAIIKDPTVYEDVKTLLGNVKRNDAVKALVRYAIERENQIAPPQ